MKGVSGMVGVAQTRLIDDMLDMARIMSGKLRLEMQPVDLAVIALGAIDVVAPPRRRASRWSPTSPPISRG